MRVFYDCEFLEDGRTIDLISIGMVTEDGRELYAVAEEIQRDPLRSRICEHQWLMKNVIPHLPQDKREWNRLKPPIAGSPGIFHLDQDDNRIMPRRMLRNAVRDFLAAAPDLELWAWYGAYGHVCLAQLFGPMIKLPAGVPMYTRDLKQECDRLGLIPPEQVGVTHDALADARWLRDAAQWVRQQEEENW